MSKHLLLIVAVIISIVYAKFTFLPPQFANHAIYQRDATNTIFGKSDQAKGSIVILKIPELGQQFTSSPLTDNGYFEIKIDPQQAGGPYTFELNDGNQIIKLNDTLFGDVFLCGGQSNMCFMVSQVYNSTFEIEHASFDKIRLFRVSNTIAETPQEAVKPSIPWSPTTPASVKTFSAACYFFGRNVYEALNRTVPIGLITSCYGGTIIQAWMSPEALKKCGAKVSTVSQPSTNQDVKSIMIKNDPPQPNRPSVLWNGMISPLTKLSLKGFTWYQGEANVAKPQDYKCFFNSLVEDWRSKFNTFKNNAGFYFVQLAPYATAALPEFRNAQLTLSSIVPAPVGMAVTVDLGDKASEFGEIHPRDKQHVGFRLALQALYKSYGYKNLIFEGPRVTLAKKSIETKSINITIGSLNQDYKTNLFINTDQCTECCNTNHKDFEVLVNGKWEPAPRVALNLDTVVISGIQNVEQVKQVRFDWKPYPQCAIVNYIRLPMSPFEITLE